ncbi:MAG: beta-lactamase family protein [Acidobacteria bacterium]|nr:beta-lactamase family protein [Acidobacteriota bacterium]
MRIRLTYVRFILSGTTPAIFLLAVWSGPILAQPHRPDFSALDKVALAELNERGTPGAAVTVISDGQLVHAKGYGVASIETGAPVTPEMLFRLGSTTKMFTAAALVTLAAQGKLKLDEPVGNFVNGLHLGMSRTTLRPAVAMTYPLTMGHRVAGRGRAEIIRPAFNNVAMWPGGSIYSNVGELARFVIALLDGGRLDGKQVLSPLVVENLPAPHVALPGAPDAHYGYGLMSYRERGVRVVTHGGASTGYSSTIQLVPEYRFAVIVLTNRSGETLPQTRVKAMELALPLKATEPETVSTPQPVIEAEMRGYTGTYSHAPLGLVWIYAVPGCILGAI